MRTQAPPLLAIFRSQLQGELLARVLLGELGQGTASAVTTISDLARDLDKPLATVHREVVRLEQAGLLTTGRVGRARTVAADETNPAINPLRELVTIAFGPKQVIAATFGHVAKVDDLLIFGDWAARYQGEPGPLPGAVELLVVGTPDRSAVEHAAATAGKQLGRAVSPTVVSAQRWAEARQPFLQQLARGPLVRVAPAGH
jgi:hypothetical protein